MKESWHARSWTEKCIIYVIYLAYDLERDGREASMKNHRFIKELMYIMVSLTLTLTSCGGESRDIPTGNTGITRISGVNERTDVLKNICITPSDPFGINSGAKLQFNAKGIFSDNSVQDLTMMVVWTSSDASIATVSNAPDSKGQAIAISRGYCSISATMGNISSSTIIGVN